MKTNKNRLIRFVSKVCFANKCVWVLFLACFALSNSAHANYSAGPIKISFNYEEGNANDAGTIRKNATTPMPIPEYNYGNKGNFAYIAGQSNLKIKVVFGGRPNANYLIKASVSSGEGFGDICEIFVAECDLGTTEFIVDVEGTVPNSITKETFTWKWEITALPKSAPFCPVFFTMNTEHTYYVLLAEPKAPMEEPWAKVLDYACSWASGQTSYNGAISAITNSLYSSGVTYNGSQHYTYPSYEQFHLTDLLYDIDVNINDISMDCRDFANFSQVLFNAIGGNMLYYTFHNLNICGYYYGTPIYCFDYNYLLPAGLNSSPATGTWNFHQVGFWANKIVDASTMIDNDSDPTASPHTWKLSVGDMSESQYFDKLSEDVLSEIGKSTCVIY